MTTSDLSFKEEVIRGLSLPQKKIPPKFLYDHRGSLLFEAISELNAYYPTRTEIRILREHTGELSALLDSGYALFEFGSGSSLKTRILLDHLSRPIPYFPVDISRTFLMEASRALQRDYPDIPITPICADFTRPSGIPAILNASPDAPPELKAAFLPGSTLGNLEPQEAQEFLSETAEFLGPSGALIVGIDLVKDVSVLEAAYNDSEGVTAAFNLNLLTRINRELGADFRTRDFKHRAFFNSEKSRMEMHLESSIDQTVRVCSRAFQFRTGETIHTESSYKFRQDSFKEFAAQAGFETQSLWTDPNGYFAVTVLRTPHQRLSEQPASELNPLDDRPAA